MEQSILVTGAYGGMGRATVRRFSEMGFRVFALDQNVLETDEGVIPIEVDVSDEQSVKRAIATVGSMTDRLYAVIHFAGVYMLDSLVEMESEAFEKIFKVNLGGVFLINKYCLPLLGQGSRILITTSELSTLDPLPFTGVYAVSKAALDKYAYSLRMELQMKEIGVSVLRAGAVDTGMIGGSVAALDRFCLKTVLYTPNAARFRQIVQRVEARRVPPEAVAKRVQRIVCKARPRFAYSINRNPLLLLLNALPKRCQLWIVRQILKKRS